MPVISDVRHPLMYYDTNTLSLLLWDGSLQAGGLVIGHVIVDSGVLTDTELRATPVAVSLSSGLTQYTEGAEVSPHIGTMAMAVDPAGLVQTMQVNGTGQLLTAAPSLIVSLDSDASHNPLYLGLAVKGSLTSAGAWQIRKFTIDANNNVSAIRYANASEAFNAVWDDRASLSYS